MHMSCRSNPNHRPTRLASHSTIPCDPALTGLVQATMAKWWPSTHWLHHGRFWKAIFTALLLTARLQQLGGSEQGALPALLTELWLEVLGMLLQQHWSSTFPMPVHIIVSITATFQQSMIGRHYTLPPMRVVWR